LLGGIRRRRRQQRLTGVLVAVVAALLVLVGVTACGGSGGSSSDPYVTNWCNANWQSDPWGDSSANECVQSVDQEAADIKETPDTFLQDLLNAANEMSGG
jgi:hypothetical protein